jgi:site-specific DNA recombinase
MRNVIAYLRVSTEEQACEGVSLAAQERQLRAHCDAHGLELLRVERDEGVSGSRLRSRAGLQRALASLRSGEAAGLVVAKLDRLSRSTRDVLDLVALADRQGWELHSLSEQLDTGTPHGRFFVTMLAGLAQMEREQIAERTRAGMAELRRQGKRISGRPPFGFRFEGSELVEVPAEQAILDHILELLGRGLGARRIRAELGDMPNPRTGRAFGVGTLQAVLRTAARRASA